MFKKLFSALLCAAMLTGAAATSAFAAEVEDAKTGAEVEISEQGAEISDGSGADVSTSSTGSGKLIYFDASGWKNYSSVFCHIWQRGKSGGYFDWKSKKEQMKKVSGEIYSYDLDQLANSTYYDSGMSNENDYCVAFAASNGAQTSDTTIGLACVGDTAKITSKMIETPMDSEKSGYECVWTKNSKNFGPHLAFTSIGNIVGSVLCPHESGIEVIGDWLPTYYKSPHVDPVKALTKALPAFKVTDIQSVYAYIHNENTGEDEKAMMEMLEKAYKAAYNPATEPKIDPSNTTVKKPTTPSGGGNNTTVGSKTGNSSGTLTPAGNGSVTNNGTGNSSGASPDGQEDIIFFALAGVMIVSGAVIFLSRKKEQ